MPYQSESGGRAVNITTDAKRFVQSLASHGSADSSSLVQSWKRKHIAISQKDALKSLAERKSAKPSVKRNVCYEAESCVCHGDGAQTLRRMERRLAAQVKDIMKDIGVATMVVDAYFIIQFVAGVHPSKLDPPAGELSGVSDGGGAIIPSAAVVCEGPVREEEQPTMPADVFVNLSMQYLAPFRSTFTSLQPSDEAQPQTPTGVMLEACRNSASTWMTVWELLSTLDLNVVWKSKFFVVSSAQRNYGKTGRVTHWFNQPLTIDVMLFLSWIDVFNFQPGCQQGSKVMVDCILLMKIESS